jgi:hypothetical protein
VISREDSGMLQNGKKYPNNSAASSFTVRQFIMLDTFL